MLEFVINISNNGLVRKSSLVLRTLASDDVAPRGYDHLWSPLENKTPVFEILNNLNRNV